jgi:hypothetical protein
VLYTDFYTPTEFTDNFARLNAVIKEFVVKDNINRPFLNIKMIDLNRQTLPLYKRLDEKNRAIKLELKNYTSYKYGEL